MMRALVCVFALVVLVVPGVQTFVPVGSGNTHVTITGNAVMKKIYEVCEAVAESEGSPFKPTVCMLLIKHFHSNSQFMDKALSEQLLYLLSLALCVIGFLCRGAAACMLGYKHWSGVG